MCTGKWCDDGGSITGNRKRDWISQYIICFLHEQSGDGGHKRLVCPHKAQASEEAHSQGNERATRLRNKEEARQIIGEETRQGKKEEAVQGSKEENRQEIEEVDRQEIAEEDGQDGEVKQSTDKEGRLNIEESAITDKVAREMEGMQTVNIDKSRAQVVENTEKTSINRDENIEMLELEADNAMSEDEVSGSEGITSAIGGTCLSVKIWLIQK